MSILTNRHNLPEPIVRAVEDHQHKGADYSASMLANSPRQVWLDRRHRHEATEDASDRVWALLGTALHGVLHRHEGTDNLAEQYLCEEVLPGVRLSGTADLYESSKCAVVDYKVTSVWTIIYGSRMEEWESQLNGYAWLYRRAGFPVKALQIVALLRDWSAGKVKEGDNYPKCMVVVVDIPLWDEAQQAEYITTRVKLHEASKATQDDDLPPCTPKETWNRGRGPVRCGQYCRGRDFCNQYKKSQSKEGK